MNIFSLSHCGNINIHSVKQTGNKDTGKLNDLAWPPWKSPAKQGTETRFLSWDTS